jgi:hypothetical protein
MISCTAASRAVIDDPIASQQRDDVRRIVFCTGKLYYDLALAPSRNPQVALVRVEELYPWPHEEIQRIMDKYPAVEQVVWAQEEPKNQGAWTYVQPRLRASAGAAVGVRYVGRPERASPAEGFADAHQAEQARIVAMVMDPGECGAEGRAMTATALILRFNSASQWRRTISAAALAAALVAPAGCTGAQVAPERGASALGLHPRRHRHHGACAHGGRAPG